MFICFIPYLQQPFSNGVQVSEEYDIPPSRHSPTHCTHASSHKWVVTNTRTHKQWYVCTATISKDRMWKYICSHCFNNKVINYQLLEIKIVEIMRMFLQCQTLNVKSFWGLLYFIYFFARLFGCGTVKWKQSGSLEADSLNLNELYCIILVFLKHRVYLAKIHS